MSRPLLWLTAAFATGIALQRFLPSMSAASWVPVFLFAGLVCLFAGRYRRLRPFFLPLFPIALFFGLGVWAGGLATPPLPFHPKLEAYYDRPQTVFLAEVTSSPDFLPGKIRLPLRLNSALTDEGALPVDAGVLLTVAGPRPIPGEWLPGDRLIVRLTLKRFHNFNNPGGFDYVRHQAERGFHSRAFLPDDRFIVKLAPGNRSVGAMADGFRQRALLWLLDNLEPDNAAFYASVLIGYQRFLSNTLQEHLNRAGVTHLLSISGLHLGLVGILIFWAVRSGVRLLCPNVLQRTSDSRIALFPALLCAVLYSSVSGFAAPPIQRALLMLALCLAAAFSYRPIDPLTILAAAALAILLVDPNALFQVSFQLSFACMIAIFTVFPKLAALGPSRLHPVFGPDRIPGRLLRPFEEAFLMSIAVNLIVLPLTVYYFNGVSLAGLIANVVLVPLVGFIVLPLGLLALALFTVSAVAALPVLKLGSWSLSGALDIIAWFSGHSWAFFWVGSPSLLWICGIYLLLCVGASRLRWKWKGPAIAAVLLLMFGASAVELGSPVGSKNGTLRVDIIDVGQGTSCLVRFPDDRAMLVDGGGFFDDSFDIGRNVVAPFLWRSGVRRLDYVVLSHDHPDHRNGLRFILSNFDVGCFLTSGVVENAERSDSLTRIAVKRGIPLKYTSEIPSDVIAGSCVARVLHPSETYLREKWNRDLNNASVVLWIQYGETGLVLPGDIDQSVERVLFENSKPSGKVLLVAPHHGSERSNGQILYEALKPQAVVFSCGEDNRFGFPSPTAIQRCAERHIPIYRTDLQGAIHAASDGRQWTITAQQDPESDAKPLFGRCSQ